MFTSCDGRSPRENAMFLEDDLRLADYGFSLPIIGQMNHTAKPKVNEWDMHSFQNRSQQECGCRLKGRLEG